MAVPSFSEDRQLQKNQTKTNKQTPKLAIRGEKGCKMEVQRRRSAVVLNLGEQILCSKAKCKGFGEANSTGPKRQSLRARLSLRGLYPEPAVPCTTQHAGTAARVQSHVQPEEGHGSWCEGTTRPVTAGF